jgi:hypothetical protein
LIVLHFLEFHITKWYTGEVLESVSDAFRDIQNVRKMHFNALRRSQRSPLKLVEDVPDKEGKLALIDALKKDLDLCCDTSDSPHQLMTYHPKLFFSQFDMTMTQFGFFSIIFLFPSTLGVRDTRGIEGFIHLWAVLGRMLGIEDRFNLALFPDRELHLKILYKLGFASLKDMDLTILHLQQTYADALSRMLTCISLKSSLYFGLSSKQALPDFKGENLYALMNWKDKLNCMLMGIVIFLMYHVDLVRRIMNFGFSLLIKLNQRIILRKNPKKSKMAKKGPVVRVPSTVVMLEGHDSNPGMTLFQRA